MNIYWRTGLFLALGAMTIAACKLFSEGETNPVAGVVVWLPEDLPGYVSTSGVMGPEERKWLPADTTFYKKNYLDSALLAEAERIASQYRAQGGEENESRADNILAWIWTQGISATLIVAGSDSRSLHRPQVCLTAQHWTIEKREVVTIETDGGPLKVMDFHLARTVRDAEGAVIKDKVGEPLITRAHYIYWWIGPDGSTPSDEERVWLEVWNSILKGRKERWAYPSVMVYQNDREAPDVVRQRAFAFIKKFAPGFQKSLGAEWREGAIPLKEIGSK